MRAPKKSLGKEMARKKVAFDERCRRYELLKAVYTATASNALEYEAAAKRAAREAGI
jgi:hypothetical protein